jgi:hypothetical protein
LNGLDWKKVKHSDYERMWNEGAVTIARKDCVISVKLSQDNQTWWGGYDAYL